MKKDKEPISCITCKHASEIMKKRDERDPNVVWCSITDSGKVADCKHNCENFKKKKQSLQKENKFFNESKISNNKN